MGDKPLPLKYGTATVEGVLLEVVELSPLDAELDRWCIDHFGVANPAWLSPSAKADLKKRLAALGGSP